jgi:hypothetical protein
MRRATRCSKRSPLHWFATCAPPIWSRANVSGPAAAAKAAALERAIYSTPVRWRSSTLVVGASAGVAPIGALDAPAELLTRANAAMYARKGDKNTPSGAQSQNLTQ